MATPMRAGPAGWCKHHLEAHCGGPSLKLLLGTVQDLLADCEASLLLARPVSRAGLLFDEIRSMSINLSSGEALIYSIRKSIPIARLMMHPTL